MEPFRISASQLTCYGMCPRKYRYRYVEDVTPQERSIALAFGTSIHEAIHWALTTKEEHGVVDVKLAQAIFAADLYAQESEELPLAYRSEEKLEDYLTLGEVLLPQALHQLLDQEIVRSEHSFETLLPGHALNDGTPIHLTGIFDGILKSGDIIELKTGKKKPSHAELDSHIQLSFYLLARFLQRGEAGCINFLLLHKSKSPGAYWFKVHRRKSQLSWFAKVIQDTVRSIDAGVFPPRISWPCWTCEYRKRCQKEETSRFA